MPTPICSAMMMMMMLMMMTTTAAAILLFVNPVVVAAPPVRIIESPDGDVIDCIHKRNQPAFDHPLLANHKIQTNPPEMPKNLGRVKGNDRGATISQIWHLNGTWCPRGTVPIRRRTTSDLTVNAEVHEHAAAYTESDEIYGAKATINVWDPLVQEVTEFSVSQIWVTAGTFVKNDVNTIEVGWQVSQGQYGDKRPRLFIYWTKDAYQSTGCYNLDCPGFIHTNEKIALGAAISPVSTFDGSQYEITVLVWKDPKSDNWWLSVGDGTLVGYWPVEIFTHLKEHATTVFWGGEIIDLHATGSHTTTQMGSGHYAGEGFRRASYFRNLETVDFYNNLNLVQQVKMKAENPSCYNIQSFFDHYWGTYFYYGGPGKIPRCL